MSDSPTDILSICVNANATANALDEFAESKQNRYASNDEESFKVSRSALQRWEITESSAACEIRFLVGMLSRLATAIRVHRDMEWDDRCLEDDKALYAVLGEPIPDFALPPKGEMLESCRRYIEQRGCPVASLPPSKMTIRQMEDEMDRLNGLVAAQAKEPTP